MNPAAWHSRAENLKWLRLLVPGRRRVGYLGWLGHENIGDEVMFEAAQQLLARSRVRHVPAANVFGRVMKFSPRPLVDCLTIGGGTLIGHEEQRRPFEDLWERYPDTPAFSFGSGVEHPDLDRSGVAMDLRWRELYRWRPVLERFRRVAVRGPLSAGLLADIGVDCEVVGDPALLLGVGIRRDVRPQLLGLNLGRASTQWGNDPERVLTEIAALVCGLMDEGWTVRLFPMTPADELDLWELQRRCGAQLHVVRGSGDTRGLLNQMAECEVFVGLKLHSVILATAVSVPTIVLEYQPKCRDFHASIDRDQYTVRTDVARATHLRELVESASDQRDGQSRAMRDVVAGYQQALRKLGAEIELAAS